jgi:hypothetical protein
VEGSGRGLIRSITAAFVWRDWGKIIKKLSKEIRCDGRDSNWARSTYSTESYSSPNLSTINPTRTDLKLNPGLRDECTPTNNFSQYERLNLGLLTSFSEYKYSTGICSRDLCVNTSTGICIEVVRERTKIHGECGVWNSLIPVTVQVGR